MTSSPAGRRRILLLAVCGAAIAGVGFGRGAVAAPAKVVLVAPQGSRLADELKRELEISGFTVVPIRATAGDWKENARAQASPTLVHVATVRDDDRQMIVFSYSVDAAEAQPSLDIQLDPDTRLARRRACLTVVEFLRVQGERDPRPRSSSLPPEPETPEAVSAATESDAASGSTAVDPTTAPPSPPVSTRAAAPAAARAAVSGDDAADSPGGVPVITPPSLAWQHWTMGIGTTLDLASTWARPAGHLQFMWYFPLTERLSVRIRAHWPLFAVDFQADGENVRTWMFGAAVGVQCAFAKAPARWRPFVGFAAGNRIQLTEVSSSTPLQSRTGFTPSITASVEMGIRYALSQRFQLLGEFEAARDWLLSTVNRTDREIADANAVSFHTSVGALFEY